TLQDLLELKKAIKAALEQTNDEISIIPSSEHYDETFEFMIRKARNYVYLLEQIDKRLKQLPK
nr:hypothetical protein [Spirosomataceae bacterium]